MAKHTADKREGVKMIGIRLYMKFSRISGFEFSLDYLIMLVTILSATVCFTYIKKLLTCFYIIKIWETILHVNIFLTSSSRDRQ